MVLCVRPHPVRRKGLALDEYTARKAQLTLLGGNPVRGFAAPSFALDERRSPPAWHPPAQGRHMRDVYLLDGLSCPQKGLSHERDPRPSGHLRARDRRRRLHRQPHLRRAASGRLQGRHRGRPLQRLRKGRGPHQDHRRPRGRRKPRARHRRRQRPRRTGEDLLHAQDRPCHPLCRLQGRGRVGLQAHRVLHQQPGQHPHAR